jgi:hypothetical protein
LSILPQVRFDDPLESLLGAPWPVWLTGGFGLEEQSLFLVPTLLSVARSPFDHGLRSKQQGGPEAALPAVIRTVADALITQAAVSNISLAAQLFPTRNFGFKGWV